VPPLDLERQGPWIFKVRKTEKWKIGNRNEK
jgi:hypothetical protein